MFAVIAIAFHPHLGISLANDRTELGCPVFSTLMKTVQCFDDKHGMSFVLPELGAGNKAEKGRAVGLEVGVGNIALI